ncbi:MAG: hypothetical protein ACKO5P_08710 [Nodosilinea sp.]|jgi:hypothetical protein
MNYASPHLNQDWIHVLALLALTTLLVGMVLLGLALPCQGI